MCRVAFLASLCYAPPRKPYSEDLGLGLGVIEHYRWIPHPVMLTMRDHGDYVRALLYSYSAAITGWGVHPKNVEHALESWSR